jgi:hypothetical protein
MAGKRGPKTLWKVKLEIWRLKKAHTDWITEKIRKELLKEFKGTRIHIPQVSTINNILNEGKDKTVHNPLDDLWSLAGSIKYNIPDEASFLLLEVAKRTGKLPFTIREARWIYRLYPLLEKALQEQYSAKRSDQIDKIVEISQFYAYQEEIREIEGISNNTYNLDKKVLIENDFNEYYKDFPIVF